MTSKEDVQLRQSDNVRNTNLVVKNRHVGTFYIEIKVLYPLLTKKKCETDLIDQIKVISHYPTPRHVKLKIT
jgi:hypothetical protein